MISPKVKWFHSKTGRGVFYPITTRRARLRSWSVCPSIIGTNLFILVFYWLIIFTIWTQLPPLQSDQDKTLTTCVHLLKKEAEKRHTCIQ
ncbi:hypothetical protein DD238_001327 [Peronospora effusa]|uniref:Uncharacterized protein n=1 Tax=Peronospora effusa TaxID=542832 RepID=A0A3M6VSU2_9STRA|nr:hypothetical protein DD238_001327 [Peronospora effusa]RQM09170.1 hypothetical protein DD237_000346 [Peronospora effusa]